MVSWVGFSPLTDTAHSVGKIKDHVILQICDLLKIVESLAALYKSASSASITPCIAACETSVASTTSVFFACLSCSEARIPPFTAGALSPLCRLFLPF